MKLNDAVDMGFSLYLEDKSYAASTASIYKNCMKLMAQYLGDLDVRDIQAGHLRDFFRYLEKEYIPNRVSGLKKPLGPSGIKNHQKAVHRFFDWALEEFGLSRRPDTWIKLPKQAPQAIRVLDDKELATIFALLNDRRMADTIKREAYQYNIPLQNRDRAMVLVLLDTGMTSTELCSLIIDQFDPKLRTLSVVNKSCSELRGDQDHSRTVYICKKTAWAIKVYLDERPDFDESDPLFTSEIGYRLTNEAVRSIIRRLGGKAEISDLSVDIIRDTYIVTYLRRTNDIANLKNSLGVRDIRSLSAYWKLAKLDVQTAHEVGSPVEKWFGESSGKDQQGKNKKK
jgi:site-specific recombinase XerD